MVYRGTSCKIEDPVDKRGVETERYVKHVIEAVASATLWMIWRYRNDVVHEARVMKKDMLFDAIREFSFQWCNSRNRKLSINWTVWLQNPLNALIMQFRHIAKKLRVNFFELVVDVLRASI
ncbi:hypothetical protein LXL04_033355 [Taraxacum kok-saghyz]